MRILEKELKIPSSLDCLNTLEKFVEEICDNWQITNTFFGNMLLSIEEAVKNAILHGNKSMPEKVVKIFFKSKPIGLSFTITDEGEGFDYKNIPNPLSVEDCSFENTGRGLFLIRTLADEISFNPKGNKLEIVFKVSSINRDTSIRRINELTKYFTSQKIIVN